jgi:hypothetical protein
MRAAQWVISGLIAALPVAQSWAADGNGLTANADSVPWARWQGRLSFEVQAPLLRADPGGAPASGLQIQSISLLRDYYLTRSLIGAGTQGGLHTTGGLIVSPGSRSAGQALFGAQPGALSITRRIASPVAPALGNEAGPDGSTTIPYLGVGYMGQSTKGGWSFNADLGLVALEPGNAVKFGRVFSGSQSLYDLARDMRVAPVMQMGLSYSF